MSRSDATVVLATRNQGKVAELAHVLEGFGLDVRGLDAYPQVGEIAETGATFEENARIKARAVCAATGLVAVADDSGLAVDALDGAPGVYSARYAGPGASDEDNWRKLLRELESVPPEQRGARFVCVMVAAAPDGREISARGEWEGRVTREPRGEGGFGYDPVFHDPDLGRTAAQLSREEKHARSHRGKALQELLRAWPGFAG